mmetsp:Transcript_25286/g.72078  ORF Transcript_25286/g.72078 Transcript_25286/m.72078 type:complete len:82 (+) Transcript_25286:916-1161(+)
MVPLLPSTGTTLDWQVAEAQRSAAAEQRRSVASPGGPSVARTTPSGRLGLLLNLRLSRNQLAVHVLLAIQLIEPAAATWWP